MELTHYVDDVQRQLTVAAEAGGEDARVLAERLTAALEPALRLVLLEALSDAADEITRELAPGSVELRLRAGQPGFAVTQAAADEPAERGQDTPAPARPESEEGTTARINLRLPEQLKAAVEQAASSERLSVNTWLVRVAATALAQADGRARPRTGRVGQSYTGWVQ